MTNYNAFISDVAFQQGVEKYGASWGWDNLTELGQQVGSDEWQRKSLNANNNPPRLETFDRFGRRQDSVAFQADYHSLMMLGLSSGCSSFAWQKEHRARRGAHVIRGGLMYLMYQLNPGVCCPITMTFAAVPALEAAAAAAAAAVTTSDGNNDSNIEASFIRSLTRKLFVPSYDGGNRPLSLKEAATVGMSMTEKQGGSDVRANTTVATAVDSQQAGLFSAPYTLRGHKWFTSAPMSDAFLTLAHTDDRGVSCFVVPRWLPDGTQNVGFQLQRLKEKMGDKSNASSEVEYRDAIGYLLGEEGRGVRTIVDMVVHTRLDCVIGSAALMRQCSQLATHHCSLRSTFGKPLIDQPLMRAVLADLALESESAMALWMRLASSLDRASNQTEKADKTGDRTGNGTDGERKHEAAFVRLATAVSKYWVCKRAPTVAYEAMEVHGGNGYVEEGPMAALYRQSPLNAIWEGSGNVICLDVLRAIGREPESVAALFVELEKSIIIANKIGANVYEETLNGVKEELKKGDVSALELGARSLVDRLALCLSASVLMQDGDVIVAKCFVRTRMPAAVGVVPTSNIGSMAGTLLDSSEMDHLIERMKVECR